MPKSLQQILREHLNPGGEFNFGNPEESFNARLNAQSFQDALDAYHIEQEREWKAKQQPRAPQPQGSSSSASSAQAAPRSSPASSSYINPPEREARMRKGYPPESANQSAGSVQIPQYMHDYIQELLGKSRETAEVPYEPYVGPRIAGYSPQHEEIRKGLRESIQNQVYNANREGMLDNLGDAANNASSQNQQIGSMLRDARKTASSANPLYNQFTNPYQEQILQNLQDRSNRNLRENILPQIRSSFISQGAYHSGKRNEMEARAARDLQDTLIGKQAEVMTQGHEQALQGLRLNQEKDMNLANLSGRNLQRTENSMRDYLKDLDNDQRQQIIRNEGLANLEEQDRQNQQRKLDLGYEDHLKAADFPYLQQSRFNEAIRGLPNTGHTFRNASHSPAQAAPVSKSNFSNIGDMLGTFASMAGSRHSAAGGHYATGGSVTPERDQMMGVAHDFIRGKHDLNPYAMATANMFAHSGANPRAGDQLGNMAQALPAGVQGFTQAHQLNTNHQVQAANLASMIDQSRSVEKRAEEREKMHGEEMAFKKLMHNDHMGMQREALNARLSAPTEGHKPQLKEIDGKLYEVGINPETGKTEAQEVAGIAPKEHKLNTTEADNKALTSAQAALQYSPKLEEILKEMKKLAPEITTGPSVASLNPESGDGAIVSGTKTVGRALYGGQNLDALGRFNTLKNQYLLIKRQMEKGTGTFPGAVFRVLQDSKMDVNLTPNALMTTIDGELHHLQGDKAYAKRIITGTKNGKSAAQTALDYAAERFNDDETPEAHIPVPASAATLNPELNAMSTEDLLKLRQQLNS